MGKIKFDHAVIYNGVFYSADTPIEEKKVVEKKDTTDKKGGNKAGADNNGDKGTV